MRATNPFPLFHRGRAMVAASRARWVATHERKEKKRTASAFAAVAPNRLLVRPPPGPNRSRARQGRRSRGRPQGSQWQWLKKGVGPKASKGLRSFTYRPFAFSHGLHAKQATLGALQGPVTLWANWEASSPRLASQMAHRGGQHTGGPDPTLGTVWATESSH